MHSETGRKFLTLHEFAKAAKNRLTPGIWDYLTGATETETTLRRNRLALDTLALRPRVLRDVSKIDTTAELFGRKIRLPVALAPVGGLESLVANGAATVGQVTSAFGLPMLVSSVTKPGLENTAAQTPGPKIFQLYVRGGDDFIDDHAQRCIAAGYDAFCFTVDSAVYSRRERDIARGFAKPWRAPVDGPDHQAALSWPQIARFKAKHAMPVILKGIATAEDAQLACEHGVDVVYVSNHGGRQLDHGRGTMDVLPEVVQAVAGRARIWIDGGFSRGTDVVKALCLGADLVAIGRLYCYALAADGAAGLERMLEILETEIHTTMGLLGAARLSELNPGFIHAGAPPTNAPHVLSAFPLLNLDDPGY